MAAILIFIFLCYFALVIGLILGWQRAINQKVNGHAVQQIMVSVIIPVRNEAKSVQHLMQDLKAQNYPLFEVIVVDDHSNDNTTEVVTSAIESDERFKTLQSSGQGKKMALTSGIKEARGAIIVTTDADCHVGSDWLKIMAACFNDDAMKLAFGGVRIQEDNSFFSRCQAMEFSGLIGSGAATLMFGFPSMCNGANLAFRKETFEELGGYTDNLHVPSGDDEFMLHKVFNKYPSGIHFINDSHAVVSTAPQLFYKDFMNQRIRWAGKWRYHGTIFAKLLALVIFAFHLISIFSLVLCALGIVSVKLVLILWSIKVLIEFIFLKKVSIFLGNAWRWLPFFLLQIVYPFYAVGTGLISNFMSFEWKGRTLKSIHVKSVTD